MIQKRFRLTRIEVESVIKNGFSQKTPFFIIRALQTRFSFDRFGVIISKKFHPKAYYRNKVRRQIYESIRKNTPPLNEPTAGKNFFDIVLIPSKRILDADYQTIESAIISIFSLKTHG